MPQVASAAFLFKSTSLVEQAVFIRRIETSMLQELFR
jgi:hypothetical protein